MTNTELLHELESLLEAPSGSLQPEQQLSTVRQWDSMSSVLVIAFADEKLGMIVSGSQIARAKSVEDLLDLLSGTVKA